VLIKDSYKAKKANLGVEILAFQFWHWMETSRNIHVISLFF